MACIGRSPAASKSGRKVARTASHGAGRGKAAEEFREITNTSQNRANSMFLMKYYVPGNDMEKLYVFSVYKKR